MIKMVEIGRDTGTRQLIRPEPRVIIFVETTWLTDALPMNSAC